MEGRLTEGTSTTLTIIVRMLDKLCQLKHKVTKGTGNSIDFKAPKKKQNPLEASSTPCVCIHHEYAL